MKRILLIRHAKSDWTTLEEDFDRPLNERGHKDAPRMAKHLLEKGISINQFLTSPAKRALTTCRYFAEVFQSKNIIKKEELYNASSAEFLEVIEALDNSIENVAIFSHNNGISHFANSLTEENIIEMPTCSVVSFKINTNDWRDFKTAEKVFLFFDTPKEI